MCDHLILACSPVLPQTPFLPAHLSHRALLLCITWGHATYLSNWSSLCHLKSCIMHVSCGHVSLTSLFLLCVMLSHFSTVTLRALSSPPSHKTFVSLFQQCFSSSPHYVSKRSTSMSYTESLLPLVSHTGSLLRYHIQPYPYPWVKVSFSSLFFT